MSRITRIFTLLTSALGLTVLWIGCDSDISGNQLDNQPPNTTLSVRDTSLVDNLEGADRFTSTVQISWSGDDPDGFVQSFDIRFYNEFERPGPEEGWSNTVATDTLVLLPIPRGEREANVVYEARSIDDQGAKDPSPARTVFPIENGPPTIRFSPFDLPPDTSFSIISAAWIAVDPEGTDNLKAIQVSFNDSTRFVDLPPNTDFASFVGQVDINDQTQTEVSARVFIGRGFIPTDLVVPGLLLNAENTLYIRAIDATDTTSTIERTSWYVKKQTSKILYVNDYRTELNPTVNRFHLDLLREFLPPAMPVDLWTITTPFVTGAGGNVPRSSQLPPNANPTLRQMLGQFKYIYWVSTNTTSSLLTDNFPFVASVMDIFFDNGGKLMMHSPVAIPANPEDVLSNAAILLLPISGLVTFPDSLRQSLRLLTNAAITPLASPPGTSQVLPVLKSAGVLLNTLPFEIGTSDVIPLYSASYKAITRSGSLVDWGGPATVASISSDQRVGLFSLPLINDFSGDPRIKGDNDDLEAPRTAIKMMLESLGFPR